MKHVYNITCSQVLVKIAVHFEEKPFFLATLTSCKAHFKFKFRYGIYIWYFGYYSSSEVSSELLESSKLIINSSVATLGLVLDGLAANAAESITGDHAASPFTRRCCGIFGSRCFGSFDSTCVGIVCSRQVAAAVASSRLDAYLHPRLSPEFDLETRPH